MELGHVTARWGLIESWLGFTIAILLGHQDRVGKAITAELSTMQRVAMIGALVDCTNNPKWTAEWDELARLFNKLKDWRNEVVHGVWRIDEARPRVVRSKARGKQIDLNRVWTESDLKMLSSMESMLVTAIIDFVTKMSMEGVPDILRKPPSAPAQRQKKPPSREAQLQAQARARKKAQKDADRATSQRGKPPQPDDDAPPS